MHHFLYRFDKFDILLVIILNIHEGLFGFPPQISPSYNLKFINLDLPLSDDEERRLFFVALTRAKKHVYLFTWRNNESKFLDFIPTNLKELFPSLNNNKINAEIVKESEKALKIKATTTYNEPIHFWIPKSQIISDYKQDMNKVQCFTINPWWVENKFNDII